MCASEKEKETEESGRGIRYKERKGGERWKRGDEGGREAKERERYVC